MNYNCKHMNQAKFHCRNKFANFKSLGDIDRQVDLQRAL